MAQVLIRQLDDDVKQRLKQRARKHHRTMEAEIRTILTAIAYEDTPSAGRLGTRIAQRFAGLGFTEPLEELPGQAARPADFGP